MSFRLINITKSFDGKSIFKNFNIEFSEGKISCILGPSGCGKTTLLNIMCGLAKADEGIMDGFCNKNFSYIFQEPRLLPWKNVRDNIDFVLSRDISSSERRYIVDNFLKLVELEEFADYYPSQLSGGMSQRVSLARAFASPSQIILMDEPLSGLDISLKHNLIQRFINIWRNDKRSVIYVTHDIDEALMLCDEIFVLSKSPVKVLMKENIDIAHEERDYLLLQEYKAKCLRAMSII